MSMAYREALEVAEALVLKSNNDKEPYVLVASGETHFTWVNCKVDELNDCYQQQLGLMIDFLTNPQNCIGMWANKNFDWDKCHSNTRQIEYIPESRKRPGSEVDESDLFVALMTNGEYVSNMHISEVETVCHLEDELVLDYTGWKDKLKHKNDANFQFLVPVGKLTSIGIITGTWIIIK